MFIFSDLPPWALFLDSEEGAAGLPRYIDFRQYMRADRKYFCPRSPNRVYKNSRNLKRHIRYEAVNSTVCHLCNTDFPDRQNLIRHMHLNHSRMVYAK